MVESPVLFPIEQRIGAQRHGSAEALAFGAAAKHHVGVENNHSRVWVGMGKKVGQKDLVKGIAAAQEYELDVVRLQKVHQRK